jgi:hypothetical protein
VCAAGIGGHGASYALVDVRAVRHSEGSEVTPATPRLVALDSATLANISRDYSSEKGPERDKALALVAWLRDHGVFIVLTTTHIIELIRLKNDRVFDDRRKFLGRIPLVAWPRPYTSTLFPGNVVDVLRHELHAAVHRSAQGWGAIVQDVRSTLWETGVGTDLGVEHVALWPALRAAAGRQQQSEIHVASVARTDPDQIMNLKLGDAMGMPRRRKEDIPGWSRRFAEHMKKELDRHGDERLGNSEEVARAHVDKAVRDIDAMEQAGVDSLPDILAHENIPAECISPTMTLGDVCELVEWAQLLAVLSQELQPPAYVTMRDVAIDTLPSYALVRKLGAIQRRAERVSASDLGDARLAALVLYADAVGVDKRTREFLNQLRREDAGLGSLMGQVFCAPDYGRLPELLEYSKS